MNGGAYHFYHAHALGVAGTIDRADNSNFVGTLPSTATTSLSHTGGEGSQTVKDFSWKNFLSFRKAEVSVSGKYNEERRCHETIASSVVEGLNINDTVTADRIISKLTSWHPKGTEDDDKKKPPEEQCLDEPLVSPEGSCFENLRIAGRLIDAKTAAQEFRNYGTYSSAKGASGLAKWLLSNQLQQATQTPSLAKFSKGIGGLLQSHGILACSLVSLDSNNIGGLQTLGSVIIVPNFGVVHLAELLIQKHSRRLNMLRLSLGSPVQGDITTGDTFSNGTTSPPS